MTSQIEQENTEPNTLQGEVFCPNERRHIFKDVDSMLSFIKVFNIKSARFASGYIEEGVHIYELLYVSSEN